VLEDNLRVPSGVSYMLEDRKMMMRLFPELFAPPHGAGRALPGRVAANPAQPAARPRDRADRGGLDPACTTAPISNTPSWPSKWVWNWWKGRISSFVEDKVYMRTTRGPRRVDVIYRRVDDDFLDPKAFRPHPPWVGAGPARRLPRGTVTISNAIGTGVADDKSIYPYVPEMIRSTWARSRSSTTCPPTCAASRKTWPTPWPT
jgi:hypothetical protein